MNNTSPPFFFRTCPFCKIVEITITSYGKGFVSCDCGIKMKVASLASWEKLHDAAADWGKVLNEVMKQKDKEKEDVNDQ